MCICTHSSYYSTEGSGQSEPQDVRRGSGIAAVFLARNRFAVLDKNRQVSNHYDCRFVITVVISLLCAYDR
jgi:hypothetical protein